MSDTYTLMLPKAGRFGLGILHIAVKSELLPTNPGWGREKTYRSGFKSYITIGALGWLGGFSF